MSFTEIQKFRKPLFWMFISMGALYLIIHLLYSREHNGALPPALHFIFLVSVLSTATIFWLIRINTRIDMTGIYLRSVSFGKGNEWKWGEISRAYLREYSPLREFGGWGIRYSFKNGRAYSVQGRMGLQLELSNGNKILIGTQKPEELQQVLHTLKEQYRIEAISMNP